MSWSPGETLESIEREAILKALRFYQNNHTHTARSLGIALNTLKNKLALYREQEESSVRPETQCDVESALKSPSQFAMPMQQREEVQALPPKQDAPRAQASRRHRAS